MDAPAIPTTPPAPTAPPAVSSATAPSASAPFSPYAVQTHRAQPAAPQNVLAWVAFGLGLGGIMFGLLASVPAIVLGHIARRQLRERGEQGDAAALTGLISGYVISALWVLGIVAYVLFFVVLFGAVAVSSGVGSSI